MLFRSNVGLQREIFRDLVVEASYVGNRGVWWRASSLVDYNALQPSTLQSAYGLDWSNAADRTILASAVNSANAARFRARIPYAGFNQAQTVAQSLRPFPQFTTLAVTGAPIGNTWYDSLQMKATKRLSHGLDFTWVYTYSKELILGADNDLGGGVINDVYNRAQNKQLSSFSRPHLMVLAANYTLPKWGPGRIVQSVVRDWQIGAVLQYSSGLPIQTPTSPSNNNSSTLLRPTFATRVADLSIACAALTTAACPSLVRMVNVIDTSLPTLSLPRDMNLYSPGAGAASVAANSKPGTALPAISTTFTLSPSAANGRIDDAICSTSSRNWLRAGARLPSAACAGMIETMNGCPLAGLKLITGGCDLVSVSSRQPAGTFN